MVSKLGLGDAYSDRNGPAWYGFTGQFWPPIIKPFGQYWTLNEPTNQNSIKKFPKIVKLANKKTIL